MRDIFETIASRYLIAILNLVLIFINAKALGVEGVGLIGLIIASINIAMMFNGILSGNTIVYFMNRYNMKVVFLPSYIWTLAGSLIACSAMEMVGMLPDGYFLHIYLLSILMSLVVANSRFLLGKDHIKGFNITYMLQGGILFIVLLYLYYGRQKQVVSSYILGMYIANSIAFIISFLMLYPHFKKTNDQEKNYAFPSLLKEMFIYGLWGSADNIAETLTTRLNYFLIGRFGGLSSVGLLDAGTKMSESVWHINRSVGFIEYSRVAKNEDKQQHKLITLQYLKLTFCAITLATTCILLIPEWVYTDYLFSTQFQGIRKVIAGLSVGIISFGCNGIISQYFIGSGKIRYSAICSFIGLTTLLIAGLILIPLYGVVGSAICSSIAFCCMLCFSLVMFCKITHTKVTELLINKNDWEFIQTTIRRHK